GTEVQHVHAGWHHDNVAVLINPKITDELFQLRFGWDHERNIVPGDAPTRLVVVAMNAAGNVRARVSLRPAAVDRRPNIEDDKIRIRTMSVQPLCRDERLRVRVGN